MLRLLCVPLLRAVTGVVSFAPPPEVVCHFARPCGIEISNAVRTGEECDEEGSLRTGRTKRQCRAAGGRPWHRRSARRPGSGRCPAPPPEPKTVSTHQPAPPRPTHHGCGMLIRGFRGSGNRVDVVADHHSVEALRPLQPPTQPHAKSAACAPMLSVNVDSLPGSHVWMGVGAPSRPAADRAAAPQRRPRP